jgi:tetratricopeptide (TPR) repeat protein
MRIPKKIAGFLVLALVCSIAQSDAQSGQHAGGTDAGPGTHLGQVHFPVSCSLAVQKSFNTAAALLHSFQYDEAHKAFSEIAERDPHCAMAYWGEAMSLYDQLWDFPNAAQLERGRAAIQKAQEAGPQTGRERAYIGGVAAFYQANPKLSHDARAEAYSKAMSSLYARYPGDVNAGAFYALSLVALAQDGVNEMANRRHAIAILQRLFREHPENPGVDHYLIHASDSPQLASYGLAAARNYAKIAPDSAHALHMPSHIFTRLGYWHESIDSNIASAEAAREATRSGRDSESGYQIHALTFLEYAFLQSGQDRAARHVVAEVLTLPGDNPKDLVEDQALFQATYDLETHQWKKAAALTLPRGDTYPRDRVTIFWTRTIGAARIGAVAESNQDFQILKQAYVAMNLETEREGYKPSQGENVGQMEAQAWLEDAEGHYDQAVKMMQAAVHKEGPNGVDILGMPAQEMLGDLLLRRHRANEALVAYQAALKESPNRFDGLYGAARAAEIAGQAEEARSYYAKLVKASGPHADREELQQAKLFVAQK